MHSPDAPLVDCLNESLKTTLSPEESPQAILDPESAMKKVLKWSFQCPSHSSLWRDHLFGALVVANAAFLGFAFDEAARGSVGDENPAYMHIVDFSFQLLYLTDLVLCVAMQRSWFLRGHDRWWNLFDALCITVSIVDQVMSLRATRLRLCTVILCALRLLRIAKLLRAFPPAATLPGAPGRELLVLLRSVRGAARSLAWCLALFIFLAYVFALIFVQAAVEVLHNPNIGATAKLDVVDKWGSIAQAMRSLVDAAGGRAACLDLTQSLGDASWIYGLGLLLFVGFVVYGLLNALNGSFVDSFMRDSATDDRRVRHRRGDPSGGQSLTRDVLVGILCRASGLKSSSWEAFRKPCVAPSDSGALLRDFSGLVEASEFLSCLANLGISVHNAEAYFTALSDSMGSPGVDPCDFADLLLLEAADQRTLALRMRLVDERQQMFFEMWTARLDNLPGSYLCSASATCLPGGPSSMLPAASLSVRASTVCPGVFSRV